MDKDEAEFTKADWNTYNDEREIESCTYCGDELNNLNIVYYQISPKYDMEVLAINPMPHEHVKVTEGWIKRIELVCDKCINEEYDLDIK